MQHNKETNHIVQKQLAEIRSLLDAGKKAPEIAELLDMKPRTVEYRIMQLRKRDKEQWKVKAIESLDSRAYKILESLEYCIKVNKDIADNSKDDKARIDASKMVVDTNVAIYQFLEHGPLAVKPKIKKLVQNYAPPSSAGLG